MIPAKFHRNRPGSFGEKLVTDRQTDGPTETARMLKVDPLREQNGEYVNWLPEVEFLFPFRVNVGYVKVKKGEREGLILES